MKKILIIGATSAIAKEIARRYASKANSLYLVARNQSLLASLANDLRIRGAESVAEQVLDCNDFQQHKAMVEQATESMHGLDIAIICHGTLPDQTLCQQEFKAANEAINTNGLSVVSLLTELGNFFAKQGSGTIAVITSVAGDRGRQPNFVYGAAKSLVSTYIQGLRGRLHARNVQLIDIKPGFVDSPMTASFDKGALWSSPALVANIIVKSIEKNKHTVYAPFYWRYIMLLVCSIPEFIFKRLKL